MDAPIKVKTNVSGWNAGKMSAILKRPNELLAEVRISMSIDCSLVSVLLFTYLPVYWFYSAH
jgi:hypothetical protein